VETLTVDEKPEDQQLQKFIDANEPARPTSDDLVKLGEHAKQNPRKKGADLYVKIGLGIIVFVVIRLLIALLREL